MHSHDVYFIAAMCGDTILTDVDRHDTERNDSSLIGMDQHIIHLNLSAVYFIAATNAESSGDTPLTSIGRHDIEKNDSSTIGMGYTYTWMMYFIAATNAESSGDTPGLTLADMTLKIYLQLV